MRQRSDRGDSRLPGQIELPDDNGGADHGDQHPWNFWHPTLEREDHEQAGSTNRASRQVGLALQDALDEAVRSCQQALAVDGKA